MKHIIRLRTSILLLTVVAGALALSLLARPKPAPQYAGQRSLYAAYHLQGGAELVVSNSTMHDVTLEPQVYGLDGRGQKLQEIALPAQSQKIVELTGQIKALGPNFWRGGMVLRFSSKEPGVAAQLVLSAPHGNSTVDVPLRSRSDYLSRWLEAIWRRPRPDAQLEATVSNHSRTSTRVTISLTNDSGTALDKQEFVLEAYQSRPIDFTKVVRATAGEMGGISIEHFGKVGTVVVSGSVKTPFDGRLSSMTFIDKARIRSEKWHGAGVQIGDTHLGKGFTGKLLLRSLAEQTIDARLSLQCGEDKVDFGPLALAPGASAMREFSPESINCPDRGITLVVETPARGTAIAQWMSTDQSGELVVHTPLHSVSPKANLSGSDPFWTNEETASVLYVTNAGAENAVFVPVIHPNGTTEHGSGHQQSMYSVGRTTLRPGETAVIDIRALRDQQKPDDRGTVLPADMTSGQIHWLRREGPAVVANLVSVSAGRKSSASFSFFCCFCSPTDVQLGTDPSNVVTPIGDTKGLKAFQYVTNCHGFGLPEETWDVNWSSLNPTIASVSGFGDVTGVATGTTQILVTKDVILNQVVQGQTECESGPCEPPEEYCDSWWAFPATYAAVEVPPAVAINPIVAVGVGETTSFDVVMSGPAAIQLIIARTTGTGDANFKANNSTTITISQSGSVSITGVNVSSTNANMRVEARYGDSTLASRDFTVVGVQFMLRTSGSLSSDNSAAPLITSNYGSTLGTRLLTGASGGRWGNAVEIVAVVSPSNFAEKIVLRRVAHAKDYEDSELKLERGPDFPDSAAEEGQDRDPQSGGSGGKVYDWDAPGIGTPAGNPANVNRLVRQRANFKEWAETANGQRVSGYFFFFNRLSVVRTSTSTEILSTSVSNDNVMGTGTTSLSWNLQ